MNDSFGDGWNGNKWTAFGKDFTINSYKKSESK
jgi:hypothetical protein